MKVPEKYMGKVFNEITPGRSCRKEGQIIWEVGEQGFPGNETTKLLGKRKRRMAGKEVHVTFPRD